MTQTPDVADVCPTCNGRGEIGGFRGQTAESYEEYSEPCPDCVVTTPDVAGEGLKPRGVGRYITFHPAGEEGNAVVSPEEPDGTYWTLIGSGPDVDQNRQAAEIVRRLNLPFVIPSQATPSPAPDREEIVAFVQRVSRLTVEGKDHTEFAAKYPLFAGLVADARSLLAKLEPGS